MTNKQQEVDQLKLKRLIMFISSNKKVRASLQDTQRGYFAHVLFKILLQLLFLLLSQGLRAEILDAEMK
jgi:hypothetical protein